ncbi:hypothetical protein [Paraburkholderia solisilvae]|uniref:hypothetical protein n=1 Tax=Paraburkholderia solisilvae TaxID=624376 RepID=UPI0015822279|nr:hypothetical protein [Paraburkholderia solisilvae]
MGAATGGNEVLLRAGNRGHESAERVCDEGGNAAVKDAALEAEALKAVAALD